MRLTPRKTEIESVTAMFTSDDYDTAEDMAKALIKTVAQLLSERNAFGVAIGFADSWPGLAIGPFYSTADAQACVSDALQAGMEARIARLCGTSSIKSPETRVGGCGECGHDKALHPKSYKCLVLPTCGCLRFKETKE
jgi:hypothetical protein